MTRDKLSDIRIQAQLQRSLTTALMDTVAAMIECGGLHPDNALKAVRELAESEERLAKTRHAFARTYA